MSVCRDIDMRVIIDYMTTNKIKIGWLFKRDAMFVKGTAIGIPESDDNFRFDFEYIGNPKEKEHHFFNFLREKAIGIYESERTKHYESLTLENYIKTFKGGNHDQT